MNTINQSKTYESKPVSFRAIQPEVMQNIEKLPRITRRLIGENYNTLMNSELVDLSFRNNKLELCMKKNTEIFGEKLKERDWFNGVSTVLDIAKIEASKMKFSLLGACHSVKGISLDFGFPELAQKALKSLEGITKENADEFIPQFGALIEIANKLRKPITEISKTVQNGFVK